MGNIATCSNGHNYDAGTYQACPYCPKSQTGSKTVIEQKTSGFSNTATGTQKTAVHDPSGDSGLKTVVHEPEGIGKTVLIQGQDNIKPHATRIVTPADDPVSAERRLVGFLVSYDLHPKGKSFKIFEGKNLIGSDPLCDIIIAGDQGISGRHLTIMFRNGLYRFKDEFSDSGTFINGQMKEDGELSDKNIITLGNTRFIFLSIPTEIK